MFHLEHSPTLKSTNSTETPEVDQIMLGEEHRIPAGRVVDGWFTDDQHAANSKKETGPLGSDRRRRKTAGGDHIEGPWFLSGHLCDIGSQHLDPFIDAERPYRPSQHVGTGGPPFHQHEPHERTTHCDDQAW